MTKILTRLFDNYSDAANAVRELESMGVPHGDISIVANDAAGTHGSALGGSGGTMGGAANATAEAGHETAQAVGHSDDHGDVSRGTSTGALVGGAGGLLAGLGLLAIPGLGPIVAAGWLLSTAAGAGIGALGGAATGSIVGSLKNAGHTDEEASVYSEGVRRGSTLVSARVPDSMGDNALMLFGRHNGVDASTRGSMYRESGWSNFDEKASPYTTDQITTERSRYSSRM